jgi:hypothetical protein
MVKFIEKAVSTPVDEAIQAAMGHVRPTKNPEDIAYWAGFSVFGLPEPN